MTHTPSQSTTHHTLSLPTPPPNALTLWQHSTPSPHLPTEKKYQESTPEQHNRLHKRQEPPGDQSERAISSAISKKRPPKLGNIHVRTSLGVQSLLKDNTIQSNIPSPSLEATRGPLSLKSRRSSPLIHKAKAARPGTAWRADCDMQRRSATQTKRYKDALEAQDPGPTFLPRTRKGRSPAEAIATPRLSQDAENPNNKLEDGDNFSTHTQEKQSNSHNMSRQSPTIEVIIHTTIATNKNIQDTPKA